MILNRSKAGQLDRIYKLCNASIDIVSEKIENYLSYIKVEKNTMLRVRLSVEEVLLRWHEVFPEETEFRLTMGSHWNRPFIILKLWGEESDELGPVGIQVNYVCPGPVDTPMMLRIEKDFFGDTMTHEEAMAMLAGTYAMDKRYAKPEEIANAVLYLSSDVSAHTAGMGMHIDSKVSPTS